MKLKIVVISALFIGAVITAAQQGPTSSSNPPVLTPVTIANGGTGQITALAGFNALSPLTTRGDLLTRDASNNVRFAKCSTGQVLGFGANDPACDDFPHGNMPMWATGAFSPAAGTTTYCYAMNPGSAPSTPCSGALQVGLPSVPCVIKSAYSLISVLGTKDTGANNVTMTVAINDVDVASSSATFTLQNPSATYSVSGLSGSVAQGNSIKMKIVTPAAWSTSPTLVIFNGSVYCEAT